MAVAVPTLDNLTRMLGGENLTEVFTFISSNREILESFGMKNSHVLRAQLERLMREAELSSQAKLLVYLFCTLGRKKERILQPLESLADNNPNNLHLQAAFGFVRDHMVTWVTDETLERFATIHVPNTNPSIAGYCWCASRPAGSRTLDNFLSLPWSPMISLNNTARERNLTLVRSFWVDTVKKTTHEANRAAFSKLDAEERFDRLIYDQMTRDNYPLFKVTAAGSFAIYGNPPYSLDSLAQYLLLFGE
jgi:hypothetical protein